LPPQTIMSSADPCTRSRCFAALHTNLSNGLQQFRTQSPPLKGKLNCFDADKFRSLIGQTASALAHEANKLALAFSSDPIPSPEETRLLCAHAEQKTVLLLSMYLSMSPECGTHLIRTVSEMCAGAVEALLELVKSLEAKEAGMSGEEAILRCVRTVWDKCDAITKTVPARNNDCCSRTITTQRTLVSDAVKELEEALKTADEEGESAKVEEEDCPGETWTAKERMLVAPGMGLLKAAAAMLKKVAESVQKATPSHDMKLNHLIRDMDDITDLCAGISPIADDLAWSLYAPIDRDSMLENAQKLKDTSEKVLETMEKHSRLAKKEDFAAEPRGWGLFLLMALRHNFSKINDVDSENRMADMNIGS
jgi:hypothetical protein